MDRLLILGMKLSDKDKVRVKAEAAEDVRGGRGADNKRRKEEFTQEEWLALQE